MPAESVDVATPACSEEFRPLLRSTSRVLLIAAVLVVVCYYVVDRPVAFFVHERRLYRFGWLKWLTEPPPLVQDWSPAILAALVVRRGFGPWRHWQRTLFAACIALIIADQFRESLRDVFGRYWPETWIDGNPSLIRDGAYGFHFFRTGSAYGSFPSGHTARTLAAGAVAWLAWPRARGIVVFVAAVESAALVAMNYHFVGDVIAGGFLGGLIGAYAAHFCGVSSERESVAAPHCRS